MSAPGWPASLVGGGARGRRRAGRRAGGGGARGRRRAGRRPGGGGARGRRRAGRRAGGGGARGRRRAGRRAGGGGARGRRRAGRRAGGGGARGRRRAGRRAGGGGARGRRRAGRRRWWRWRSGSAPGWPACWWRWRSGSAPGWPASWSRWRSGSAPGWPASLVAVALGVGAGVAERAAGVTTFASAESCMLADSPEPRKPPVTRTATTTRTRAEHMSAPLSPPLVRVGRSGGGQRRWFRYRCSDMAGAWLWVTNALNRCRPPRRIWRPATWDVTVSGPDRFRLRPVQPECADGLIAITTTTTG